MPTYPLPWMAWVQKPERLYGKAAPRNRLTAAVEMGCILLGGHASAAILFRDGTPRVGGRGKQKVNGKRDTETPARLSRTQIGMIVRALAPRCGVADLCVKALVPDEVRTPCESCLSAEDWRQW